VFRLFKHYVPYAVLFLALVDLALLLSAAEMAWVVRARQIGMEVEPVALRYWPLLNFAVTLQLAMVAVGVYGTDAFQSLRFAAARLVVAICLGVIFLSVVYFTLPGYTLWRSNSLYAMGFAFVFLISVRVLLARMFGSQAFKRRVLVLGAGQRAARLGRLGAERATSFLVVGHIDMGDCESVVATAVPRAAIDERSRARARRAAQGDACR
jgi:FlaA1/EpsC-like NDP-sugar epimerase